ncbi:photosystem II assembly protein Psb34 [Lyngbya confervoides]|uniref:Ssl1498 family light-harvesting-like protein n=1 Tax=Lyngbya confervoides BDU141951 TaxID=1574623 RepID=A0ABD4T092_9CYAN|nr:ssl1498 family light-harvesting-like protein [Lyngbya confervoides]MCM1981853.1 ssl1498 family light-harvesting-like protein [Lyngbya confervoides BDU141951]
MPYTTEEDGKLNNFAVEPKMYEAEPPSQQQRRIYSVMAIISALLVVGLIAVAFTVS